MKHAIEPHPRRPRPQFTGERSTPGTYSSTLPNGDCRIYYGSAAMRLKPADDQPLAVYRRFGRIARHDNRDLDNVQSWDDLAREMCRDSRIRGARRQILSAVKAGGIRWLGGNDDQRKLIVWQFGKQLGLVNAVVSFVVEAYLRGFRMAEIRWAKGTTPSGYDYIESFSQKDQGKQLRIWESPDGKVFAIDAQVQVGPEPKIQPSRSVGGAGINWPVEWRTFSKDSPEWERWYFLSIPASSSRILEESALESCYKPWYSKIHMLQWWDVFIERLGGGVLKGTYTGTDADEFARLKAEFLKELSDMKQRGILTVPRDWEIAFETMSGTQVAEVFKMRADYCDDELETAIVLQTGTSGSKLGGGIGDGGHKSVRETFEGLVTDLQEECIRVLENLATTVGSFNFGADKLDLPVPEFIIYDPEADKARTDNTSKGVSDGVLSPHDPRVIEAYGYTPMTKDDLAKAVATKAAMEQTGLISGDGQVDTVQVDSVLDRYASGETGQKAATVYLRALLPHAGADEIAAMLDEAQELRPAPAELPPAAPVALPPAEPPQQIAASDVAAARARILHAFSRLQGLAGGKFGPEHPAPIAGDLRRAYKDLGLARPAAWHKAGDDTARVTRELATIPPEARAARIIELAEQLADAARLQILFEESAR